MSIDYKIETPKGEYTIEEAGDNNYVVWSPPKPSQQPEHLTTGKHWLGTVPHFIMAMGLVMGDAAADDLPPDTVTPQTPPTHRN